MLQIDLKPINEFRYNQISNHNFQFLLLDEELRALHSPFQCKDYFQDMFWVENTGNEQEVYGMEWKKGMLDINVPFFKMALLGGSENLQERIPYLQQFLNTFENAQGFPPTIVQETDNPKHIVITFSREWTVNGPLLSAFTSLIRLSAAYQGGSVVEYIKQVMDGSLSSFPKYMSPEVQRVSGYHMKLGALLKGMKVEHDWAEMDNVLTAHCTGIMGFSRFPEAKLE